MCNPKKTSIAGPRCMRPTFILQAGGTSGRSVKGLPYPPGRSAGQESRGIAGSTSPEFSRGQLAGYNGLGALGLESELEP